MHKARGKPRRRRGHSGPPVLPAAAGSRGADWGWQRKLRRGAILHPGTGKAERYPLVLSYFTPQSCQLRLQNTPQFCQLHLRPLCPAIQCLLLSPSPPAPKPSQPGIAGDKDKINPFPGTARLCRLCPHCARPGPTHTHSCHSNSPRGLWRRSSDFQVHPRMAPFTPRLPAHLTATDQPPLTGLLCLYAAVV